MVNQIIFYLLSRVVVGLGNLAIKKGTVVVPEKFKDFRWFSAVVWAFGMWLFHHHKDVLQPSLQASLTYLLTDSNQWSDLRTLLWHNK